MFIYLLGPFWKLSIESPYALFKGSPQGSYSYIKSDLYHQYASPISLEIISKLEDWGGRYIETGFVLLLKLAWKLLKYDL